MHMARTWIATNPGDVLPTRAQHASQRTYPSKQSGDISMVPAAHEPQNGNREDDFGVMNSGTAQYSLMTASGCRAHGDMPQMPFSTPSRQRPGDHGQIFRSQAAIHLPDEGQCPIPGPELRQVNADNFAALPMQKSFPVQTFDSNNQLFDLRSSFEPLRSDRQDMAVPVGQRNPMVPGMAGRTNTEQAAGNAIPGTNWPKLAMQLPPSCFGGRANTARGAEHRGNLSQAAFGPPNSVPTLAEWTAATDRSRQAPSLATPRGVEGGQLTGLLSPMASPVRIQRNHNLAGAKISQFGGLEQQLIRNQNILRHRVAAPSRQGKRSSDQLSGNSRFEPCRNLTRNLHSHTNTCNPNQIHKKVRFRDVDLRNGRDSAQPALGATNPKAGEAIRRNGCSEDPTLFRNDNRTLDEAGHQLRAFPCTNTFAHRSAPHFVCSTCHEAAAVHVQHQMPDLDIDHWWPLCKPCGETSLRSSHERVAMHGGAALGCSCQTRWLCFQCQLHERYAAKIQSEQIALAMRQPIGLAPSNGKTAVLVMGWRCVCGDDILRDANVLRCSGCEGLMFGAWTVQDAKDKAVELSRRVCAWT